MKYVLAISLYFVALAHRGLLEDFNSDDMMNLCVSYLKPLGMIVRGAAFFWTGYIRPLGALFYLLVYAYAGFWSKPFRVACFALLILNLALMWRLFRKLSESKEFAALALLVVCFHASMSDIYMSTGTVYDILCQTFFLIALTSDRWWVAALCTVAAVDSKEVGVAIPAVMLAYDVILRPRKIRWPAIGASGAAALIFLWSRLLQPNDLTNHELYKITLTVHQYVLTTTAYINQLLFHGQVNQATAVVLFLLPLTAAALLRSRLMLFGWLYFVLALAPMSFAPPRFGYALYIPYTGVAILFAALFQKIGNRKASVAFAALVVAVQVWQSVAGMNYHPWGGDPIRAVAQGVGSLHPSLPKGSRLMLVNDPFGKEEIYSPLFVLTTRYRDRTLKVAKATWDRASGPFPFPTEKYDHIILFAGDRTWELTPGGDDGGPLPFVTMSSPDAQRSIVKDIGGISPGEEMRWVNQDPTLSFRVPKQPAKFQLNFDVPDVVLKETGPLHIACWIADRSASAMTINKAGARTYETPAPEGLRTGEVVTVRLHVKNPYIAKADQVRLSFLLRSAGFVSE